MYIDGPTFHHFSNGSSLNRIVVVQDHVGGERGSYVFNSEVDIGFFLKQVNTFVRIESKFEYFQKQVDI